jgi:hypothetical protein
MGPDHVKNVTWEPDQDHDVWIDFTTDTPPTRETHPDAFYRVETEAYPKAQVVSTRKAPHRTLSRTQLRKRLSKAGLSGAKLRDAVDRVKTGPSLDELTKVAERGAGRMALGWDIEQLAEVLGERTARRVLRFVSSFFIVRDEFWDLARSLMPSFVALFYQARSLNAELVSATQDVRESPGALIVPAAPATVAA